MQERFGEIPEIEKIRIKREAKNRQMELQPPKASPYHNPQHRQDLEKIALSKDTMTPGDIGLRPADDVGMHPLTVPADRPKQEEIPQEPEQQSPGPNNDKESSPTGRPEDGANEAQKKISEIVNPAILAHYNKSNLRSLTKSQLENLEYIKFGVLSNLDPHNEVTIEVIESVLRRNLPLQKSVSQSFDSLMEGQDSELSIDDARNIRIMSVVLACSDS